MTMGTQGIPALEVEKGVRLWPQYLSDALQKRLVAEIREASVASPLFQPVMPRTGRPFSVRMTNFGPLGWVADRSGYRYQPHHPETGDPWPPIPAPLLEVWRDLSGYSHDPEACLINYYGDGARMGLHQDADEAALDAPVLSLSLGDDALFRLGGSARRDPTRSFRLASGDVMSLAEPARLAFHGIDRIYPGTSSLLKNGGRLNITLRRVTKP